MIQNIMNQNKLLIMKEIKNQIIYIKLKNNFYKNLQLMILIIRIKINIIKNNHILDYQKIMIFINEKDIMLLYQN